MKVPRAIVAEIERVVDAGVTDRQERAHGPNGTSGPCRVGLAYPPPIEQAAGPGGPRRSGQTRATLPTLRASLKEDPKPCRP